MGPSERDPDEVDASIGDMLRKYDVTVERSPRRPINQKGVIFRDIIPKREIGLIVFGETWEKKINSFYGYFEQGAISGLIVLYCVIH